MTKFKVNDIVRIIKKPSVNQHIQLEGLVGYITEFSDDNKYIEFEEIKFNSFYGGRGSVDIDCIELCNDIQYKNKFDQILEQKRKDAEKQNFISNYEKLEDKFEENNKVISELEKEIVTIEKIRNLLNSNEIDTDDILINEVKRKKYYD